MCRYYLDLTEAQTAALLELEIGTVKRHAHRAIQRLHQDPGGEPMTALEETEARVAWALKQVAERVEITDADQRRVEVTYRSSSPRADKACGAVAAARWP